MWWCILGSVLYTEGWGLVSVCLGCRCIRLDLEICCGVCIVEDRSGASCVNFELKADGVLVLDGVGRRSTWTSSSMDALSVKDGYFSVMMLSSAWNL